MLREKLLLVPNNPGCYLMHDKTGEIIYVGKAKNLKNRLSSYFNGTHTGKTAKLVSEIADFEYVITNTEVECLVLEINLIKKYNPKYNIMLKDDKSYPYIELSNDKVPKLSVVRNINRKKGNSKLFGPYPNVSAAREVVNLLNRIYPLRKCTTYQKDVCLYYHIHECLGYCKYNIEQEKIENMKNNIIKFLKGDSKEVVQKLTESMNNASEALNFERAIEYKEMLEFVNIVLNRQKINLNDGIDRDIFGTYSDGIYLSIQVFFLRGGSLVERKVSIIPIIEDENTTFENFIINFYEKDNLKPKEIYVKPDIDIEILEKHLGITVLSPSRGEKKKLFDLACSNAKMSLEKELELILKDESRTEGANNELEKILGLKINRIEIFDNSNLFGSFSVSGMVVFLNGKPLKSEYRKYKISVDKNDDFNTMKEVIYRRYFRLLIDDAKMPDLIIVDGGENQMKACFSVLNSLNLTIPVLGLKKNDKHQTNSLIYLGREIPIDKTSDLFHYLTRMQTEVHEYTINYHRTIRSKGNISSVLSNIEGIGEVRRKELIKKYGSIKRMKELSKEELSETLPENVADKLYEYLQNMDLK